MTDDIVARLRCYADINDAVFHPWVYTEAADEIEQLSALIKLYNHSINLYVEELVKMRVENVRLQEENGWLRSGLEGEKTND
jgi:hypothetical protein